MSREFEQPVSPPIEIHGPMKNTTQLKALTFALAILPIVGLFHGAVTDSLGANPIEYITRDLGTWGSLFC
jgi:DMSO/TMAO reductase YedYZ heme-binding membrane subunit